MNCESDHLMFGLSYVILFSKEASVSSLYSIKSFVYMKAGLLCT